MHRHCRGVGNRKNRKITVFVNHTSHALYTVSTEVSLIDELHQQHQQRKNTRPLGIRLGTGPQRCVRNGKQSHLYLIIPISLMGARQRAAACCAVPALLLLLLLPWAVVGARVTLCTLKIEGHGPSKPGVKTFQLSCSGGSIVAFAHPTLAPHLASTSGVSWLPNACGPWARGCLLAICGDSTVTFAAGTVVQAASPSPPLLLCVGGRSHLAFQGARFFDNAARPITGFGPDVSFFIKASSFTNNSLQSPSGSAGAVSLEAGGSAVIEASTFTNNTVLGNGGAISIGGTGSIKVMSSLLQGNAGAACWQPPAWSQQYPPVRLRQMQQQLLCHHAVCCYTPMHALWHAVCCPAVCCTAHAGGGAISAGGSSHVVLQQTDLTSNRAEHGGGLAMLGRPTGVLSCFVCFLFCVGWASCVRCAHTVANHAAEV